MVFPSSIWQPCESHERLAADCHLLLSLIHSICLHSDRESGAIVWLCSAILILYFVVMKFVPVPGYGAGVLEPVGNWSTYIDQHVMLHHMQHPLYEGKALLGNFPALSPDADGTSRGRISADGLLRL